MNRKTVLLVAIALALASGPVVYVTCQAQRRIAAERQLDAHAAQWERRRQVENGLVHLVRDELVIRSQAGPGGPRCWVGKAFHALDDASRRAVLFAVYLCRTDDQSGPEAPFLEVIDDATGEPVGQFRPDQGLLPP